MRDSKAYPPAFGSVWGWGWGSGRRLYMGLGVEGPPYPGGPVLLRPPLLDLASGIVVSSMIFAREDRDGARLPISGWEYVGDA